MTTSHTATLSLPYPEGDEYVIGGDDAIEALAKRIDYVLGESYFNSALPTGSAAYIHGGTYATVGLNGPLENTSDFTYDAGLITYTGPRRPYTITGTAALHLTGAAQGTIDLEVGGILRRRAESYDAGAGMSAQWFTATLSWSGILVPASTIRMVAQAPNGTEVWYPALSVVACNAVWGG